MTSVPRSGDRLSHTLRRAAVNCRSHSGNSSAPAECQMLFAVREVAFWPSPVHSDCPPPPTHLISTLTPSWPFGDCPKTERHTPWLTPRCLWPREFYDISKQGEKQDQESSQPHFSLGFKICPEAPIPALGSRILHIPSVFPLNPKPQIHPDVSFPQHTLG